MAPMENQAIPKWRRFLKRSASTTQDDFPATSGFGRASDPVATVHNSASTSTPAPTLTSTELPPPPKKLGLVLLSPELVDDQIDPLSPDIIAIHGIGGDLCGTWTHERGAFWLRDFLPKDIKGARVFSFGYAAEIALTKSRAKLDDFARSLLNKLRVERDGKVRCNYYKAVSRSTFTCYPLLRKSISYC